MTESDGRNQQGATMTLTRAPELRAPALSETLTQAGLIAARQRPESDIWSIGDVIDDTYEVLGIVGAGAMGTVYRVLHRPWRLEMAVKTLQPQLLENPDARRAFVNEAVTWMELGRHPRIVSCWHVRSLGGAPRIFIEFVPGGSLADWIRSGKLPTNDWRNTLTLAIHAAEGLGYAHERGVVAHRDVKPGNLMVTPQGGLAVTDFGIIWGGPSLAGDRNSVGRGTPEYAAPEQWDGSAIDARADVYGLGVVLYELCCGRRPFDDGAHSEPQHVLIGRHQHQEPPDPRRFADVPEPLARLILRCLRKKPGDRPGGMTEIRAELGLVYRAICDREYPYEHAESVTLRADELNNKASSLWDLGYYEEAKDAWSAALHVDPLHLDATRNDLLRQWMQGKLVDDEVLERFNALKGAHQDDARYWIHWGTMHGLRGDAQLANEAFAKASSLDASSGTIALPAEQAFRELASLRFPRSPEWLHLLADGMSLLVAYRDWGEGLEIWSLGSGQRLRSVARRSQLGREHSPVRALAVTPGGEWAFLAADHGWEVWDIRTGSQRIRVPHRSMGAHCHRLVLDDGARVGAWAETDSVTLLDLIRGATLGVLPGYPHSLSLGADGRFLSVGSTDGVRVYSVPSLELHAELARGETCLHVSEDGRLALTRRDADVTLWDIARAERLRTVPALGLQAVSSLDANGDFASHGGALWDLRSGRKIRHFRGKLHFLEDAGRLLVKEDGLCRLVSMPRAPASWSPTLSHPTSTRTLRGYQQQAARYVNAARRSDSPAEARRLLREARRLPGFGRDPELVELWWVACVDARRTVISEVWRPAHNAPTPPAVSSLISRQAEDRERRLDSAGLEIGVSTNGRFVAGAPTFVTNAQFDRDPAPLFEVSVKCVASGAITKLRRTGRARRLVTDSRAIRPHPVGAAVSNDGRWVLLSTDQDVRLLDVSGQEQILAQGFSWLVGFSPDAHLAIFGGGNEVTVWDLQAQRRLCVLRDGARFVQAAEFVLGSELLLSIWGDSLSCWDVRRGVEVSRVLAPVTVRNYKGHLYVSDDARYALFANFMSLDATLYELLWEVDDRDEQ